MITRSALLFVAVLALITLLLSSPEGASAHAEYESSTPGRNEVVQQPPAQVEVIFTQDVFREAGANFVRVRNEAGTPVSEGDGTIDDIDRTRITATLQPNLPAGLYIVDWQTLSDEDGDDDDGSFCFYIQTQPTAAQEATCAEFDQDAGPTATVSGPTASPATEPTATNGDGDDDGGSGNTLIGAIVGVVIAVAVVGGAILWFRRSRAE
jgi:methionine-rich copper-binding protein CopC